MLGLGVGQVNEGEEVGDISQSQLVKNAGFLTDTTFFLPVTRSTKK
jgi:hypothetical protein